jgi:hypothetical protein
MPIGTGWVVGTSASLDSKSVRKEYHATVRVEHHQAQVGVSGMVGCCWFSSVDKAVMI